MRAAAEETFETEAPALDGASAVAVAARIGASAAAPETAEVTAGTPCLVIERQTWRADQPVTAVRLIYPGEAHELARCNTGSEDIGTLTSAASRLSAKIALPLSVRTRQ